MAETIEEIRAAMHRSVDVIIDTKIKAGDTELPAEVKAYLLANPKIKMVGKAVDANLVAAHNDAAEVLKGGIIAARVGEGRANSDPATVKSFHNELAGYQIAGQPDATESDKAMHMMRKKLEDVDSESFKLLSYNSETGKMQASARAPNGVWKGVGQSKTGNPGYNNPGSLAWKIKQIIAGKEEVIVAS